MNFKKLLLLSVSMLMPTMIVPAPNKKAQLALQVKQLHSAINKGDIKQVRKYARLHRNNLSIKNNKGNTALHEAIIANKLAIVCCLIEEFSVSILIKNNAGLTALQVAEKMKRLPIKNYLVARLAIQNRKKNEELKPEKKPIAKPQEKKECPVCMDEKSLLKLECKHEFCKECLAIRFDTALKEKSTQGLTCMAPRCHHKLTVKELTAISGDAKLQQYHEIVKKETLDKNPNMKYCPTPNCQGRFDSTKEKTVSCKDCKKQYCAQCLLPHRAGISCAQAKAQAAQQQSQAQQREQQRLQEEQRRNDEWLKNNTRPCPKCKTRIEKSGGCNKLVCKKCKTQFLWK